MGADHSAALHGPWRPGAVLLTGAVVVTQLMSGLYAGFDRDLPYGIRLLATLWFWMSLTTWFGQYSRDHRIPWPLDMGWFLLVAWMVLVPWHLIRRERGKGLLRVALFLFVFFGAWAVGWIAAAGMRVFVDA